uniref:Uncharacterized protein n=1 Tax=Arundo donax TaxID=35708 RepID=A0A0A8XU10_ARUDO
MLVMFVFDLIFGCGCLLITGFYWFMHELDFDCLVLG